MVLPAKILFLRNYSGGKNNTKALDQAAYTSSPYPAILPMLWHQPAHSRYLESIVESLSLFWGSISATFALVRASISRKVRPWPAGKIPGAW